MSELAQQKNMSELAQQRGPVRIYIDMDAATSDALSEHCKANGIAKKFLLYKLAKDFIDSQSKPAKRKGK